VNLHAQWRKLLVGADGALGVAFCTGSRWGIRGFDQNSFLLWLALVISAAAARLYKLCGSSTSELFVEEILTLNSSPFPGGEAARFFGHTLSLSEACGEDDPNLYSCIHLFNPRDYPFC
jgi:hypothetical protein